ncbi:MAG: VCBS repeat-containing protein, partial [Planctomycetota bacterium]
MRGRGSVGIMTAGLATLAVATGGGDPCTHPFFANPEFDVGNWPVSVAASDVDGDGDLDLIVANQNTG